MRIKIAEIIIEGDGADLMDLEQRIVSELENARYGRMEKENQKLTFPRSILRRGMVFAGLIWKLMFQEEVRNGEDEGR